MPAASLATVKKAKAPLRPTKAVPVTESDDDDLAGPASQHKVLKKPVLSKGKSRAVPEATSTQLLDAEADTEPEGDDDNAGEPSDMARKLAALSKENTRLKAEREAFANQFEALSTLKRSGAETVYEKAKKAAELRATAQDDLIATLTKYNDKLQARTSDMEREVAEARKALLAPVLPVDAKEVRALKEEIKRLGLEVKSRDEKLSTLQKEYDTEVSQSRRLLNASTTHAPQARSEPLSNASEELDKDNRTLKLYEDLSDLSIVNVKIKTGENGEEVSYNCVQTVEGRSLNFKLLTYKEYDHEASAYVSKALYLPLHLDQEQDQQLLQRLGKLRTQRQFPRDQLGAFWDALKVRISKTGTFDEI